MRIAEVHDKLIEHGFCGWLGDQVGPDWALVAAATTALAAIPLMILLAPYLTGPAEGKS